MRIYVYIYISKCIYTCIYLHICVEICTRFSHKSLQKQAEFGGCQQFLRLQPRLNRSSRRWLFWLTAGAPREVLGCTKTNWRVARERESERERERERYIYICRYVYMCVYLYIHVYIYTQKITEKRSASVRVFHGIWRRPHTCDIEPGQTAPVENQESWIAPCFS